MRPISFPQSEHFSKKEPGLHMRNAVVFRNIAVHAYRRIDWQIVWKIITEHLGDFRAFAEEICR
ncbi:MAG: DUF86 domain-containing protein [Chitinivibrionales bacterium]|nr:DUF86 domain-containing protein [Chitinivibrionales bacterium]MBD3394611.1 DUF86 domain-containing protein [Chitinivibrionales bacterium]